jgi:hypothetical protein
MDKYLLSICDFVRPEFQPVARDWANALTIIYGIARLAMEEAVLSGIDASREIFTRSGPLLRRETAWEMMGGVFSCFRASNKLGG